MLVEYFTLPLVPRVKVNAPNGTVIIDQATPHLASTGDVKITTVTVHDQGQDFISAQSMLARVQMVPTVFPVDSLQDLGEVLTRGIHLSIGGSICGYLITGIKLRCCSNSDEGVLCLVRENDSRWSSSFLPNHCGVDIRHQVLCLTK